MVALCVGCSAEPESVSIERVAPEIAFQLSVETPNDNTEVSEPKGTDPYAGWHTWCEPVDNDRACDTATDCTGIPHPARRPLKCVHPWYAKDTPDLKVCAPGYHRKERMWHRDRLREVIRQQYFGEAELCEDGLPMWKQHWRCQKASRKGDTLEKFLWVAYARETTGRYWKRHRLESDVKAAKTTWFREAGEYGWTIPVDESGEMVESPYAHEDEPSNPHFGERHRWHFGLGPIGQNAAFWVKWWDPLAPPEVLCREVQPFEAYLRKAEDVIRKLHNGIRCGGEPYHEKAPTWTTLHRALNLGSVCPVVTERQRKGVERFRKDARRYDLDPDQVVTPKILGRRIPRERQNERVAEIYEVLERKLPEIPG